MTAGNSCACDPMDFMSSWVVADAVLLAVRSDVMFGAALLAVGGTYAAGAAMHRRALDPALQWREAFVSGVHEEAMEVRGTLHLRQRAPSSRGTVEGADEPLRKRARRATTLVTATFLGLAGVVLLILSGHPPAPMIALVPAGIATVAAVLMAVRIARSPETRSVLANRGARLLASSLFVEVSAAMALVVTVAVVLHTEGLTAISIVEVAAITLVTRLAVRVTPWPGGLFVADVVLLVPLNWIGVPLHVGLAAVLIWRVGSLLAVVATVLVARHTRVKPSRPLGTVGADGGRLLHRALFGGLSLLPPVVRDGARRRVFDAMFALSDDPWGYQDTPYERRKREYLVTSVSDAARHIGEIGCADGHNIAAIARGRPHSMITGVDVSPAAVAIARRRTSEFTNVNILLTDDVDAPSGPIAQLFDCVILSEVLYYLGHEHAMRSTMRPIRERMSDTCQVILLHGSVDAPALHDRAVRALNLQVMETHQIDDPERPFMLTVARVK